MKKIFYWIGIIFLCLLSYYLWWDYKAFQLSTHYHANFWIFIDGKRVDLSADTYMEDIAACKVWTQKSPKDRVHLHENNMGTIHVHDDGVTWGHFFANIWYNFTKDILTDDQGNIFTSNDKKKLLFFLNGQQVENPFNTAISSEDVLIISYWELSQENILSQLEPQVTKDAAAYNQKDDPSTCSGNEYNFFKNLHDMFGHSHSH